jgi:hypothetical protein
MLPRSKKMTPPNIFRSATQVFWPRWLECAPPASH